MGQKGGGKESGEESWLGASIPPIQAAAFPPGGLQGCSRPSSFWKEPEAGRGRRPWGQSGARTQPRRAGTVKAAHGTLKI